MRLNRRKLVWFGIGSGNECGPNDGGGASHKGENHHGHHRKRRFHVARQALGRGFVTYDVGAAAKTRAPAPLVSDAPELETLSEDEIARKVSRRGMWICFGILSAFGLILQSKWMWAIYFVVAQAWTDIQSTFARH